MAEEDGFARVVAHEEMAWLLGLRTPVTNMFLMYVLFSLLPEAPAEFVQFSDDYVVLAPFSQEQARRVRYVEDLSRVKNRKGKWKESLWPPELR